MIEDEGPGIAAQDLPRVFDRFFRSDSARALPGSGLGLAIVAQYAAQFGGVITLESRPNRTSTPIATVTPTAPTGTIARLKLPLAPGEQPVAA